MKIILAEQVTRNIMIIYNIINAMIDGRNFFDQFVKNNLRRHENIRKTTTGQGEDYTADVY